MKFKSAMTLRKVFEKAQLLQLLNIELYDKEITGINEMHKVENGDLTFVDHPKYYKKTLYSNAAVVLINSKEEKIEGKTLIYCENPFDVYNKLMYVHSTRKQIPSDAQHPYAIHPRAHVHSSVIIGENVEIGANTMIYPNVTIYDNVKIGENCIIHAGCVIGSDAFYFKKQGIKFKKMFTGGDVIIKNEVEIGANTTIDAGVSASTIIHSGTKIDNLCQIGHGVIIGENCIIAAQVGIAGKTVIGNNCTVWGQAGINKSLLIADNVTILAKSGVGEDCIEGKTYFGVPAKEARQAMRENAYLQRIPDIIEKLKNM